MSRAKLQAEMSEAVKRELAGKAITWKPGLWTRKALNGHEVPVLCLLGNSNTPTLAAYFDSCSVTLSVIQFDKKGVEFKDSPAWLKLRLEEPPYGDIDLLAHRLVETAKLFLKYWPFLCRTKKNTKAA